MSSFCRKWDYIHSKGLDLTRILIHKMLKSGKTFDLQQFLKFKRRLSQVSPKDPNT